MIPDNKCKISRDNIYTIKELKKLKYTTREIANLFNCSERYITAILSGENRKKGGD